MEQLGTRAKGQPAPPTAVYEALTDPDRDPARHWLQLLDDEVPPTVVEAASPEMVVWSSLWSSRPRARVRFDIAPSGSGSDLRWTLLDEDDPGPAKTGHMCKRLQQLINGELRYSFGQ